jgi:uncharacterized protein
MTERTIDVFELARQSRRVEAQLSLDRMPRLASMVAGATGPVRIWLAGRIDEMGRGAAVLGLRAELVLVCDRCGRSVNWALDAQAGFFFVDSEEELNAQPITVDGDEALLGGSHFDWWELAEDQAILGLPISPRHSECDLPAQAGWQEFEEIRRPFSVLAPLKKGQIS